jgi:hypothetical protein
MTRNLLRILVTGAGGLLGSELSGALGRTRSRRRCDASCPRPDQAFLQRLIDYGIATGYLRRIPRPAYPF